MHSAIFVAVIPPEKADWQKFVSDAQQKLTRHSGARRLAENVWIVDLRTSLPALGHLITIADVLGISAGTLPLDAEPRWLPNDFDPTPILARSGRS